jgi:hypothetical protein
MLTIKPLGVILMVFRMHNMLPDFLRHETADGGS